MIMIIIIIIIIIVLVHKKIHKRTANGKSGKKVQNRIKLINIVLPKLEPQST
jgi:hypothetical protein